MYIYGRTQPLSGGTIIEAIDTLKACGYDGVELCFENPDMLPSTIDDALLGAIKGVLGGLPHGFSASYHKDITDDNMLSETRIAMRHAHALGARVFIISSYFGTVHSDERWASFKQRLKGILSDARGLGLVLALEPEPGFIIESTADMLSLLDDMDDDALAVNMDIGHAFLTDGDPIAMLRKAAPRIVHCHVEGMDKGVHLHRPPYDGDLDVRAYIQTLKGEGLSVPLALDLYKEDYRAVSPRCIEFLRGVV